MTNYDITLVGGGIIGLGTGLALTKRYPHLAIALLEKEPALGTHQTGHNSGVIHSGIYYAPGSLKASLCVQGARKLIAFCQEQGIPYRPCGKVIVATCPEEFPRLEELYRRGVSNQVPGVSLIGPDELREIEPHAPGIRALRVPSTAVVDYSQVAQAYAKLILTQGGIIQTATQVQQVLRMPNGLILKTSQGEISSRFMINCGGLQADRLSRASGIFPGLQIIPFRGEYFELVPHKRHLVNALIYPVPDPQFPFLGVHLSRRINDQVEAGPNSVLALKREGYAKTDVSLIDSLEMFSFPGFWRMAARHWRAGWAEWVQSVFKKVFVRSVQRLVPEIQSEDLILSKAGVRAQALDTRGRLLDDFHLIQNERILHVLNAPSPAATASLAIGEFIAQESFRQFGL